MENKKELNITIAIILVLIVVGVLVFITIKNKTTEENSSVESIGQINMDNIQTGAVGETSGEGAKVGDTVSMRYTGKLEDGTVFDSNVDPKFGHPEPFKFTLGAGQVIAGWDKGIVGMKVGEKKQLVIPPADGYGASGIPGAIPPNATLIFDVELLKINSDV